MKTKYPQLIKYLIKVASGAILYFIFRVNYLQEGEKVFQLDNNSLFYLIYTVVMVFIVWEVNDRIHKYFYKRFSKDLFTANIIFKYQASLYIFTIVAIFIGSYFLNFHLAKWLECDWQNNPYTLLRMEFFRALFASVIFNSGYLIVMFINYKRNADLEEEKIKKENLLFRYESLRNQIDPHFLFNSFSVLNTLIQTNQKLACEFLNHLSDLYRYVLDNKDNNLNTVNNELKCLDSYLSLMKIRHEDCILSEVNMEKVNEENFIPTMSLQMLVENSIKHNSFNEKKPLKIEVYIEEEFIVVKNNLNIRKTSKISAGIGLQNIKDRYEHYTNQKVEIIKSDTEFIVRLPLLNKKN